MPEDTKLILKRQKRSGGGGDGVEYDRLQVLQENELKKWACT